MNERFDELDAEERKVLREALSDIESEAGPRPDYAADLRRRLLSTATPARTARQRPSLPVVLGSILGVSAAALLIACVWLSRAEPAWASAIRRAREQAWIHAGIEKDGKHQGDLWASPEREVVGLRMGKSALLFDYKSHVFLRYDADKKKLYRAFEPESAQLSHELVTVSGLASWFRQSPGARELLPGQSIEAWKLRSALVDDLACDEYEIVARRPDSAATTLYLTVDKRQALPRSITTKDAGSHTVTCRFDYPTTVALDEQFLGIPVGTGIVDIDQSDERLSGIARSLREGRERFDDYTAFCVTYSFDEPRPLFLCEVKRILRLGSKWRVDRVTVAGDRSILTADYDAGLKAWRASKNRFHFVPRVICDGRSIKYEVKSDASKRPFKVASFTDPAQADWFFPGSLVPERACRPILHVDTFGHLFDGPHEENNAGQVLLKVNVLPTGLRAGAKQTATRDTYWLDPRLDKVAVKIASQSAALSPSDSKAAPPMPTEIELRDFSLSPRGFWYPRFVGSDLSLPSKHTTRFYVDFEDIPSDDLFRISD